MWILKDFIDDNIVPLLPWALAFLALVVFCAEFVWTDRKTLSKDQKEIVKSFFACALAGFVTTYWASRFLPAAKQPILISCIILPILIFLNNNFIKKHDIPKDWQIVLYISLVFVPLAIRDSWLLVTACTSNCLLYLIASLRSSSKKLDKTVRQVDSKEVKKNKTLYGGILLLTYALAVSLTLAYQHKAPVTFISMIVLDSIALASFVLWYIINDKKRIHWFTAFETIFIFAPFLYNPFEHFWIGSAVIIAFLVWNEYFSILLAKKYKKDRFFIFSLGLELLSISLSVGIIFADFFYTALPIHAILIVDCASIVALALFYLLFGTENFWVYTLLTLLLVFISLFSSPFGEFWILATALCALLPLIIAAFREHHWLLITALASLMAATAWLCIMILGGHMDFGEIFSHIHIWGKITGKGMIQADIIPFAIKIGLFPALCVVIPLAMELVLGSAILVRRIRRK
ncbi:hypothetical protein [uncultured Treponema sp.]|uniref:hypothetical protein n=1 Tax=uncultured Treponema sp. TaxID=162155 RepID=UPI0026005B98|nr:hypothetical protein [uncultured Treponema sp.]